MEQDNRESWLNAVALGMAPLFEAVDAPLPDRIRVAIGFTSAGAKGKAIGECWDNRLSADSHFEIFIRPDLAHAPDAMPTQIAAILAHELVHAAVGIPAGHGKAFKRVALGLGLVGPMRATTPGYAFLAAIAPILTDVGPLPHARLDTDGESTAPKKQKTRMLKCECQACGYTVRTARKWLELAGASLCPIKDHGRMKHEPLDEDDDPEPED
ncbi:transcription elongation protein SprT [Sphingobium sp. GW456-12-10-14-TSB1]|uniref:transcription elongation protein SprT n=1 Tax=Sphingobium sp. GW456-12-10-14-TSB1 TaxID=1987165 RepID=UPI000A372F7D|nr:transcription elongation protein SprT [Sphingobium sp. GW456-12-10-14-TSB1]MAX14051.1 transcription elongation protein SprT [Sphingobium sp.]MBS47437.1 transcription elongation protein SprT [Sphingobium sp.]OUC53700.1 transcription elongation protein SprT [Sphingobium sp. GW456-12-10-14-TSB1]|tara:strand:+ start:158 stop:793 length:636 start_codon:yes stop_codon:yes gene_type:complete